MMVTTIELRCLALVLASASLVGCGGTVYETVGGAREYNLGTEALERGDFSTAIRHLEKAVVFNPNQSDYRHNLACAYLELGDVPKGWPHVRKSLVVGVGAANATALKNFDRYWDRFTEQGSLAFGRPADKIESDLGPPDKKETATEFELCYYGHLENPLLVDEVYLRTLVFSEGRLASIGFHYLPHMPRQLIRHEFDGREWTTGNEGVDGTQAIEELVTEEENVMDWTELVVRQILFTRMPVESLVDHLHSGLAAQNCKDFKFEVFDRSTSNATIEWSHDGNAVVPAQREIRRIFLGKDGMYNVAYTVKPEGYALAKLAQWKEIISTAELVDGGDPK